MGSSSSHPPSWRASRSRPSARAVLVHVQRQIPSCCGWPGRGGVAESHIRIVDGGAVAARGCGRAGMWLQESRWCRAGRRWSHPVRTTAARRRTLRSRLKDVKCGDGTFLFPLAVPPVGAQGPDPGARGLLVLGVALSEGLVSLLVVTTGSWIELSMSFLSSRGESACYPPSVRHHHHHPE